MASITDKVKARIPESADVPEVLAKIPTLLADVLALYGYSSETGLSEPLKMLLAEETALLTLRAALDYYKSRATRAEVSGTSLDFADRTRGLEMLINMTEDAVKALKKALGYATEDTRPGAEFCKVEESSDFYSP